MPYETVSTNTNSTNHPVRTLAIQQGVGEHAGHPRIGDEMDVLPDRQQTEDAE